MTGAKVPKLRFPEFSGEWEEKKLGDLFKIGSGKDYKHLGSGNIPVYGTGGYMLSVDDYLYEGESVCIGRKGTIDNPVLLNGKFWTVDTLFYTHSFDECIPRFIYAIFQNVKWKEHNEGSGVPSLSKSTIEKLCSIIPSPPEQTKIAEFLGVVDEKIKALRQKLGLLKDYKRGIMQKIFTQQIRFKKDDGTTFPDWEEKKLGDVCKITTGESNREDSGIDGKYIFFDRSIDIRKSDFYLFDCEAIIVAGEGKDFIPRYFKGKFGLHQRTYAIMGFNSLLASFAYHYIYFYRNYFLKVAVGSTMPSLRLPMFIEMPIQIPHPDEQQKIADFLSSIDNKIDATQLQIDQVTQFKKGLLQQIFV